MDDVIYDSDAAEKQRRTRRFETRIGAVHQRKNTKDRKAEAQDNSTKRGKAWRREVWY